MAAPATDSIRQPQSVTSASGVSPEQSRVIWLLLVAAFVAILNETTMGVAIPALIEDLGITAVAAQWLTTAFMLTMAVIIPISGFLLRRFSTRQMFIAAMSLFSAGTLVAFLSVGFPMLLAARVIQASGTAIMMPLLMTTLMTVVPPHLRGRMMGRVSIVISLAPAIGPTVSGFIVDTIGWHWNFGLVLPIALVSLAIGAKWIRNISETEHNRIDVLSVILSAIGFGGVVFGLSQLGGHGEADAASEPSSPLLLIVALVGGAVALVLFGWRQLRLQRTDDALLDLRVFRVRNFSLAVAQLGVMSLAFFGTITLLPLYLQQGLGLNAAESGLVLLPGALAMGLAGPVIGRIYDRRGTKVLLVPGAVLVSAMLWAYALLATTTTPIWLIVVMQTLLSLGLALSFTPLITASLGSLQPRQYSYGSAIVNTLQQVAGAAGISILITTMASVMGASTETAAAAEAAGARGAFLVAAIISLPLLVGAFLVKKPADAPAELPLAH
ncbi:DHA2 family efflux MFS transporter permease subunit [Microbacterium hatanonis]|jgi:DHA2 family lincomycin resistance protein-like MFS transporter|uniref:DHA2 family efflux MFS transporter permease subunit n=1 Tax=Microbacterium hatanonis TaxID=404366 RepID=A0A5C8I359_9MICO|nr:DHA2 family efflux MFS transporter permease subunit [Microbacterium hatanonis]TXK13452.1 DHA2 family efflux MFS transporter permease subunit [Microbacterium hatanonis]